MASITVPVTDDGILIPSDSARLLGCRTGDWASIEVQRIRSSEDLRRKALYYILHHIGDAVYVGEPVWIGDGWRFPLKVKGMDGTFGKLVLSEAGDVDEARSTSRPELLEAVGAARANPSPAR